MRKSHKHVLATLTGKRSDIVFRSFSNRRDFIGLDTNILKRLYREVGVRRQLETLCKVKRPVLIIPHQVQAEFWGNFSEVEREKRSKQKTHLEKIGKAISALEDNRTASLEGLESFRESFEKFQDGWNQASQELVFEEAHSLIETLLGRGVGPQLTDHEFYSIAERRNQRKIPPGFEDADKASNKYGDFFTWAEFLTGVTEDQILNGFDPSNRLIFVSEDVKPDWRCAGRAHPFLTDEAKRCLNLDFELMNYDEFKNYLKSESTPAKKSVSDLAPGEVIE